MNNMNFGMGLLGIVLSLAVLGCCAKGLLGKDHDRDIEEGLRQVYDMGAKRVQQLRDMGYTDYDIYNWAKMNNMYSEGMNGQISGIYTPEETTTIANLRGAWKGGGPIGWYWDGSQWRTESNQGYVDPGSVANYPPGQSPWDPSLQTEAPANIGGSPSELLGSPTRQVRPFKPHQLWMAGRFEEAVLAYKRALQDAPDNVFAHLGLAGTYSLMGREKEARAEAAEVLRINPKFSLDDFAKIVPKDQSEFTNALRKAGLK